MGYNIKGLLACSAERELSSSLVSAQEDARLINNTRKGCVSVIKAMSEMEVNVSNYQHASLIR